jgi:hypothetical protein
MMDSLENVTTVYDGLHLIGSVVGRGGSYHVLSSDGQTLGKFANARVATQVLLRNYEEVRRTKTAAAAGEHVGA